MRFLNSFASLSLPPLIIKLRILLGVSLVLASIKTIAQERKIDNHRQYWLTYVGSIKIDENWSLNPDFSYRWINEFEERFQFVARAGISRKISRKISVAVGYCYFHHYSNNHVSSISRNEQRPWQQLLYQTPIKKLLIQSRIRTEQRFFLAKTEDIWRFNHRLRYQLGFQLYLKGNKAGKGVPYLQVSDEVMFNLGKEIDYNHFDQNRFNIGVGYALTDQLAIYAGYQHGWQKRNSPNSYFNTNTIKFNIIQQIDLKRISK